MDARYDDETVTLTPGFINALETLMREQMAMLGARYVNPACPHEGTFAACWTWGQCTITDLAYTGGVEFQFGGDEDRPEGLTGDVRVRAYSNTKGQGA